MTLITFQDGKVVMRDDKVGTEQACCCGQANCCRCCECVDGNPPSLNADATAFSIQWAGWNGTEYTSFDVFLSGRCCCCDLLTDVISGLTNGPGPVTRTEVEALFGGAMPGRTANAGDPYDAAWGATAPCSDYWAFIGVGDPCAGYPDPCNDTWCVDDEECFDCYDGMDGFKPLESDDPFVETCGNPLP